MEPTKSKYVYAIVTRKTGKIALLGGELPIFWLKKIALDKQKNFKASTIVKRIEQDKLFDLVKTLNP